MSDFGILRRAVVAGALAVSLIGATAGLDAAQALPAPAPLAQAAPAASPTTVQYYPHGYRGYGYHRPYNGYRRGYYGYGRRRAGVYNCGPYAYHTHLSRKACR